MSIKARGEAGGGGVGKGGRRTTGLRAKGRLDRPAAEAVLLYLRRAIRVINSFITAIRGFILLILPFSFVSPRARRRGVIGDYRPYRPIEAGKIELDPLRLPSRPRS